MSIGEQEDEFDGDNGGPAINPEAEDKLKELEKLDEKDILTRARKRQLVDLLAKLELGQLSHQEHAVLRNLLKDNGATLGPLPALEPQPPAQGEAITLPSKAPLKLPDLSDPDYPL